MVKSYKFFLIFIAFFVVVNLLIMNDIATVWSGAEAYNFFTATIHSIIQHPLQGLMVLSQSLGDAQVFAMRSFNGLLLLLGGFGVYQIGRKIFGTPVIFSTLLVAATSLLLVNIAKLATGDIWLAVCHTLAVFTQIRYLKTTVNKWRWAHTFLLGISIWLAPAQTAIFFLCFSVLLYLFHPQRKPIIELLQWITIPFFLGVIYIIDYHMFFSTNAVLGTLNHPSQSHHFYWLIFAGTLPWIGFVLSGLFQIVKRLGKREEFAILMGSWLVAALVMKSLSIIWLFAIIAAKQLENYQLPNFPKIQENIIKTFSLLNLIAAFCGAIYLMLNMFYIFEAPGFRAAMFTGAVYWMPLIFGVIGLYGKNDKLIRAGFATAGVLVTSMFWLQMYPFIESQRNLPQRVVQTVIEQENSDAKKVFLSGKINRQDNIWYYALHNGLEVKPIDIMDIQQLYRTERTSIFVLNEIDYNILVQTNPDLKAEAIKGWTIAGEEMTYWVVK